MNPLLVFANNSSYTCVVKSVGDLQNDGTYKLISKKSPDLLSAYIGTSFSINKSNGSITGEIISNQSKNAIRTEIIDKGDSMNSFKVLTVFGPNASILYLQVNDFGKFQNSESIPFAGFRWGEPISGTCKRK